MLRYRTVVGHLHSGPLTVTLTQFPPTPACSNSCLPLHCRLVLGTKRVQATQEEEEEERQEEVCSSAMNEVDAGRDRATGGRIIQSKAMNEVRRMHNRRKYEFCFTRNKMFHAERRSSRSAPAVLSKTICSK